MPGWANRANTVPSRPKGSCPARLQREIYELDRRAALEAAVGAARSPTDPFAVTQRLLQCPCTQLLTASVQGGASDR
jgi:hypothetical protein